MLSIYNLIACIILFICAQSALAGTYETISIQQNDAFRRDVMHFVEQQVAPSLHFPLTSRNTLEQYALNAGIPADAVDLVHWAVKITLYLDGNIVGIGSAQSKSLPDGLISASKKALKQAHLSVTQQKHTRIVITFYYPPDARQYSMVSHTLLDDMQHDYNNPYELIDNIIPMRQMDTSLLKEYILLEKNYLLRTMDPASYTASGLYTLLQVDTIFPDTHDYHFDRGTAFEKIRTLLLLYDRTNNTQYLDAAKIIGNGLVTSVLSTGQALSALSRLYHVTGDTVYYTRATNIAQQMVHAAQTTQDSVTTSWIVMGLLDYANINTDAVYREVLIGRAQTLMNHQIHAPWDPFNDGRLMDVITSNGNGWASEVIAALYSFCALNQLSGCEQYRTFVIDSNRWLMQNIYTSANSFAMREPGVIEGGSVRTHDVCHGLNSLVALFNMIHGENQSLRFLPEAPFGEVVALLEMGTLPEAPDSHECKKNKKNT